MKKLVLTALTLILAVASSIVSTEMAKITLKEIADKEKKENE